MKHLARLSVIGFAIILQFARIGFAQATRPSAAPIIELRGDGAALGDAYGKALGQPMRELYAKYIEAYMSSTTRRVATRIVATLFESKLRPEHLAEIKSLAATAGLDERDVMLENCFLDLSPMTACSTVTLPAGAASDHVARFARNLDFPSYGIADKNSIVLVYHPTDRYGFVTITWPGMIGALSGMNEHGLALANMEVDRGAGLPVAMPYTLLYRTILEKCKTVDEAIALLRETPRQTANNLMLMDAGGTRAVAEITPKEVVVRRGQDGSALISTNHQRGEDADTAGRCERYDYLHDESRRSFGKINVPELKSMLQHVQQGKMTMQSMIFEPANGVIYLATGTEAPHQEFVKIELKNYFK